MSQKGSQAGLAVERVLREEQRFWLAAAAEGVANESAGSEKPEKGRRASSHSIPCEHSVYSPRPSPSRRLLLSFPQTTFSHSHFLTPNLCQHSPSSSPSQVSGDSPSCSAYIASGCHLYQVEMSMEDSALIKGKESLLIPEHCEVMDLSVVNRCPHQAEIQSIALKEMDCGSGVIVGTVDSYGHLIVSQIDRSCQGLRSTDILHRTSLIAVARSFCKSIDIYDQGIHLKSLHTSLSADESSVLAVAEGCQLTIWDMRMKHNGGCVQRVSGSVGNIFYAICSADQNIAVGGSDRALSRIYTKVKELNAMPPACTGPDSSTDPNQLHPTRAWKLNGTTVGQYLCGLGSGPVEEESKNWLGCINRGLRRILMVSLVTLGKLLKRAITGLAFSSLDSDHIYIQGVDYEVFCGQWKENQKVFSFRGDSNWLGFGKCPGTDALAGWCESGSIFVADAVAFPLLSYYTFPTANSLLSELLILKRADAPGGLQG
ncbi:hypothetical protein ACLOJK_031175 [Asimina triloba]